MKASRIRVLIVMSCLAAVARGAEPALIPQPQEMKLQPGVFTLLDDTMIVGDSIGRGPATFLVEKLRHGTGLRFPTRWSGKPASKGILFTTNMSDPSLAPEGYELTVSPDSVTVRAPTQAGLFYGAETFLQLLPPEALGTAPAQGVAWEAPCVQIKDASRFKWRGLMLDVSRHFFTTNEVEQILDSMALHKLNTFHWHLVDDQGWRIQINKYPRLTEIGAWRKGINFGM